jgi:hypothetical protein
MPIRQFLEVVVGFFLGMPAGRSVAG